MTRRTLSAFSLSGGALVAVAVACGGLSAPSEFCRGVVVNAMTTEPVTSSDPCTTCVEASCCDLVGECQKGSCKDEVHATHACVLDAGRAAGSRESRCIERDLKTEESASVYACMHDRCGAECALPVCRLDPAVPRLGTGECDACFARSCCNEMNACVKSRACSLFLSCIVGRCASDLPDELSRAKHDAVAAFRAGMCGDSGAPMMSPPQGRCFASCAEEFIAGTGSEQREATCLALSVDECGTDVDCGPSCKPEPVDAAVAGDAGL